MAQPKVNKMPGPGGRGPRGPRPKVKNPGKLFARVMGYVTKRYSLHIVLVIICIFTTALSTVQGTNFMQHLIDDYITPLMGQANPNYGPLLAAMSRVATFYLMGVIAAYVQQ